MKRFILICLVLFFSFTVSFAQRNLQINEKMKELSVFTEKDPMVEKSGGKQAGVIISCPFTLNLSFASSVDKTVDVFKTEEKGGLRFYYLRFILGSYKGTSYDNRMLEIFAQDFIPLRLKIELNPSEKKWYEVFDPNATVGVGCFYQYYNEGVNLFKQALYKEAQEKYKLSMQCNDVPPDLNVKEKIANIDSILSLRKTGDYFFDMLRFREALDCYYKILSYNNDDQYVTMRSREAYLKLVENCNNYYINAEKYFVEGKWDEAKKLYEFVLQQSCPKSIEASLRLVDIEKYIKERKQRAQVIVYEIAQHTPIGISAGKYKTGKPSGYFSMRLNSMLFEAIRHNYDKATKPELNISFGWTIKVYEPVWVFFGPGYTGVGEWDYSNISDTNNKPKLNFHSAISPEIGLLGKIGPVALRYTFQYRFALEAGNTVNDDKLSVQNYIGSIKHVFGIGFCF